MEGRSVRLKDLDFDRKVLHVVQGKGNRDRYVTLSDHLIRGLRLFINVEQPADRLFHGQPLENRTGGDFVRRYSQKGVKSAAKKSGIITQVNVHMPRPLYATLLLEDVMVIMTVNDKLTHESTETTLVYLQKAQTSSTKAIQCLRALI